MTAGKRAGAAVTRSFRLVAAAVCVLAVAGTEAAPAGAQSAERDRSDPFEHQSQRVEAWQDEGTLIAARAEAWYQVGSAQVRAGNWMTVNLNADEISRWIAGAWVIHAEALAWKDAGWEIFRPTNGGADQFGPATDEEWRAAGFSAEAAQAWRRAGFTLAGAGAWRRAGLGLRDVRAMMLEARKSDSVPVGSRPETAPPAEPASPAPTPEPQTR